MVLPLESLRFQQIFKCLVGSGKGKEENENKKCRTPSTTHLKQEECLH